MCSAIPDGPASPPDVEVKVASLLDPDARELIERHRQEVIAKYGGEAGIPPTSHDLPVFLLLKIQGKSVACGAL